MEKTDHKNRLQFCRSPYLLQHAENPVDWYPWEEEAFEKAKKEDKPIFLSIGYSACHWCHVMEKESFEDPDIAKILQENFVSIKVDREERPDIDQIYQLAFQVLQQRAGGWPLSIFLTPEKKPFFGGTYFPPERRYGMPSFQEVLLALSHAYQNRRNEVFDQAKELTEVLRRISLLPSSEEKLALSHDGIENATKLLMERAEPEFGGFGKAPKFPNTMSLDLLAISANRGDQEAKAHFFTTLDKMSSGGMYDHLGGGFARYSTDIKWLIPHFEKMLYDNAQLIRLYLEGWRLLQQENLSNTSISQEKCQTVIEETIDYLAREMTAENGAFYSAQDADSEGEEGKFFSWTKEEISSLLDENDLKIFCAYFDISQKGNFEKNLNVLWTPTPLEEVTDKLQKSPEEMKESLTRAKAILFQQRETREKPFRDEKSLASWNALLISALVDAGASFGNESWIAMGKKALDTWKTLGFQNEKLFHAIKENEAYGTGFLDDYAGLCVASLDVFEVTSDQSYLAFAKALGQAIIDRFWDESTEDLYYTPDEAEIVLHRPKDPNDHAYPGGVGLAAQAFLRLGEITGKPHWKETAEKLLKTLSSAAKQNPMGMATVVRAIDRLIKGGVEIIILGNDALQETQTIQKMARKVFFPHRTVLSLQNSQQGLSLGLDPALIEGRSSGKDDTPMVYVCRGHLCEPPVKDAKNLQDTLLRISSSC